MSYLGHIGVRGITPAQHHDKSWPIEARIIEVSGRVMDRDAYGNTIWDDDSVGDELCRFLWKKNSRKMSGWSNAWPVIIGKGGGSSSGAGDGPEGGGLVSFSGVRTDFSNHSAQAGASFSGVPNSFSNGSAAAGIDVGTLNRTTPVDPGATPFDGGTDGQQADDDEDSDSQSMLPVYDRGWNPDERFQSLTANPPPDFPKFPNGTVGIALSGTYEYSQEELFFAMDPRLVAVNFDGDFHMGSLVCDLDGDDKIDNTRMARLQSMMRVVKKPNGDHNAIAWNIGRSGKGDTRGGFVADMIRPDVSTPGRAPVATGVSKATDMAPTPAPSGGGSLVLALASTNDGGPFDVGSGNCKHQHGQDEDGNHIVSLHISTKAYFRRNDTEDGALRFEQYQQGQEAQHVVPVHLGWTGGDWAWWTTSWWYVPPWEPERPQPLRPDIPTGVKDPLRPGTATGGARPVTYTDRSKLAQFVASLMTAAMPGMLAWPQDFSAGSIDMANKALGGAGSPVATPGAGDTASIEAAGDDFQQEYFTNKAKKEVTPITGQMQSYGANGGNVGAGYGGTKTGAEGDPWVYTQRPGSSRWMGGTASGGWVILPPETGMQDEPLGFDTGGLTKSTTYFIVGPGAYFGAGTPETANGGLYTGWSWGVDSATGDLRFRSHASDSTASTAVKFALGTGNFSWLSGTGFWGEFDHANTADRVWVFPNKSGTVALLSDLGGVSAALFTQTTTGTQSGIVTDASIVAAGSGSMTIAANYFTAGKTIRVTAVGYYSTVAVPGTLNIKVFLGGATMLQTTAIALAPSMSNQRFQVIALFTCRTTGVGGDGFAQGEFLHMELTGTTGIPTSWTMVRTVATGVDTTNTNLVDVAVTFDTAGNSINCTNLILEGMN